MRFLTIVFLFSTTLGGCRTTAVEDSQFLQESEDRETKYTSKLVDISSQLESHVNEKITLCRSQMKLTDWKRKQKQENPFIECVFKQLGQQVKSTGFGPMKVAPLCQIEIWMMRNFSESKNEIVRVPWKDTRYGRNKTGISQIGRTPVFGHLSKSGAEHTIVATVRVNGVLTGIDKWAHFFTTGYHFWKQKVLRENADTRIMVSRWLEGDDLTKEQIKKYRPYIEPMKDYHVLGSLKYGVLGRWSTGIISQADMYANEVGFQFYKRLAENPKGVQFRLSDLELKKMNEVHNPSKFVDGMKVDP